ncbi:hypothetical protein [Bdellovibrio bacteriovorus]|uniref:hypothetical protein n=1 Tax=Bdellovibrio bacteriovorus TaxID=959 RepID=UPI0035A710E7
MNRLKQRVKDALEKAGFKIEDRGESLVYWRTETLRITGVLCLSEYPMLVSFGAGTQSIFSYEVPLQPRLISKDVDVFELIEALINEYNELSCN